MSSNSHPLSSYKSSSRKLPLCDHCKGQHKSENCLKKKNDNLAEQMKTLMKKIDDMGKEKFVGCVGDSDSGSDEELSNYSKSMARSATTNLTISGSDQLHWNVDSGTTNSLVPSTTSPNSPTSSSLTLRTANNAKITAVGKGSISINSLPSVTAHQIPGLAESLLSVSDITNQNHSVLFLNDQVLFLNQPDRLKDFVQRSGMVLLQRSHINHSYLLDNSLVSFRASQTLSASLMTWHLCLGHISLRNLLDLKRRKEIEVIGDDTEEVVRCEHCVKGKFNWLKT